MSTESVKKIRRTLLGLALTFFPKAAMLLTVMNLKDEFANFIVKTNKDGSNKARSYLLALQSVNELLRGGFLPGFEVENIYDVNDVELLKRLGKHIHKEGRDPDSRIHTAPVPKSHVNGSTGGTFCGSAVITLAKFLQNEQEEAEILRRCSVARTAAEVARQIEKAPHTERVFRKVVLDNYGAACCLTNLNVPETLTAAVIDPGSSEYAPDNALCLSATYAEAFASHLITFDDKLRLVISKSLKATISSAIFDSVFRTYEGTRIRPAERFQPAEKYLTRHRELLAG